MTRIVFEFHEAADRNVAMSYKQSGDDNMTDLEKKYMKLVTAMAIETIKSLPSTKMKAALLCTGEDGEAVVDQTIKDLLTPKPKRR